MPLVIIVRVVMRMVVSMIEVICVRVVVVMVIIVRVVMRMVVPRDRGRLRAGGRGHVNDCAGVGADVHVPGCVPHRCSTCFMFLVSSHAPIPTIRTPENRLNHGTISSGANPCARA